MVLDFIEGLNQLIVRLLGYAFFHAGYQRSMKSTYILGETVEKLKEKFQHRQEFGHNERKIIKGKLYVQDTITPAVAGSQTLTIYWLPLRNMRI